MIQPILFDIPVAKPAKRKPDSILSQNMQLGALHAPGGASAFAAGCQCPRCDNHYGDGLFRHDGTDYYVLSTACPLHGHLVQHGGTGGFGWPNEEENHD